MLINKVQLKDEDFSYLDTIPIYLRDNLLKVFATIIYMIPKIGKDVK